MLGFTGDDPVVKETAIANLGQLVKTPHASLALEILLLAANSEEKAIRMQVARVLRYFDAPEARVTLMKLRQREFEKKSEKRKALDVNSDGSNNTEYLS